jgi:predicted dehydrogenase
VSKVLDVHCGELYTSLARRNAASVESTLGSWASHWPSPSPAFSGQHRTSKGAHVTLKVALVGCGKAADMHISGIQRLNTARIVAVCDLEPLMAAQLAARYGIANCYNDFDELLAIEKPDVLHITTPPHSHLSLAMSAIDAGCHLVVEKPLALDSCEAAQLIAHAERHSRKLTVGYTYYFDPVARMLRRLVRAEVMGETVHLESFLGYDLNGPFGSPILADRDHWVHRLPGKLFQNLLDHLLNKITEFLTDERPLVQAYSWQSADRLPQRNYDLPDELRVIVIGEKKSAYGTLSSHSRPVRHFLTFYGTKNTAHLDFKNSTITLSRDPVLPGVMGRLASPFAQGWQHIREGRRNVLRFARSEYHFFEGFNYLLSEFYDGIVHDLPVPIPYDEILRVAGLTDEITNQLRGEGARKG